MENMFTITPELLDEVKAEIYVTWDVEDEHITNIIKRGIKRLNELVGIELDFEELQNRDLLINFCRYIRNGAGEYFLQNFQDEILLVQFKEAIKEHYEQGGL